MKKTFRAVLVQWFSSLIFFSLFIFPIISPAQNRGEEKVVFDFDCPVITIKNVTGKIDLPQGRSIIGVAEDIILSVDSKYGKTTWSIKQSISKIIDLKTIDDYSISFRAPIEADDIIIEAFSDKSCNKTNEKQIKVIAPNNMHFEKMCGHHETDKNNVGMELHVYLLPYNVSFENLAAKELEDNAVGVLAMKSFDGLGHNPNPIPINAMDIIKKGRGTFLQTNGDCSHWNMKQADEPIDNYGTRTHKIPWVYLPKNTNKNFYLITNVSVIGTFWRKKNEEGKIDNFLTEQKGNVSQSFWKSDKGVECEFCKFK